MPNKQTAAAAVIVSMMLAIGAVQADRPLAGLALWSFAAVCLRAARKGESPTERILNTIAAVAIAFGILSAGFFCVYRS